ncbi:MAG: family 1 glycosylhydrolase [Clostridia bacterium]
MSNLQPFLLPEKLGLGCATAATQIEGGTTDNSWYAWAKKAKKIKDGSSPSRGNQHWELYEEDIQLMAELGIKHYRMGIEWSRIEPTQGNFDQAAIEHYREELKLLLQYKIEPLLTLHHFSNPSWFEEQGAFSKSSAVPIFLAYVTFVVEQLQDLCTAFVTINEPNIYVTNGYIYGQWPPGKKSFFTAMRVMKNLTLCHLAAYQEIHRIYGEKKVLVGFANHLRVFEGYNKNPIYQLEAKIMEYLFQGAITKSMSTGKLAFPLGISAPYGKGKYYDYIGINYYSRSAIKHFREYVLPNRPTNDLGWDIYPEGLTILCQAQYKKYQAPIWITENGTCDRTDSFRSLFIYEHIKQIVEHQLPVERYYHWTLMDNFEWSEGESAAFGLVQCDFETQKRTIRSSGNFYSTMLKTRQVNKQMILEYLASKDS